VLEAMRDEAVVDTVVVPDDVDPAMADTDFE
jgi:hypothetical protein